MSAPDGAAGTPPPPTPPSRPAGTAGTGGAAGPPTRPQVPRGWPAVALAAVLVLVAAVTLTVGGRGLGSSGTAASAPVGAAGQTRVVNVQMRDLRYSPSLITVVKGTHLVLRLTNADQMQHDLYIDGGPRTPLLDHGQSYRLDVGVVTTNLEGWCTVPGHKAAGMILHIQLAGSAVTEPVAGAPGGGHGAQPTAPTLQIQATPGPGFHARDPDLPAALPGKVHQLTFTITDIRTQVAPGITQTRWTYNGTAPGPILHGKVGDTFEVRVVNHGDMAHGIDFHAGSVAPDGPMRSIAPGQSLTYAFVANFSGAWLYHCSTAPMSLHIANGMFGAVIIDPPDLDHVARQFVFVQSELYFGPQGGIADAAKIDARQPDAVVFNGYYDQYKYDPIVVKPGERIRVWVVDAGPQFGTSFHVVGTQFDTVFKEGAYLLRPDNPEHGGSQTLDLAPAQGGFVEFTLPAPGHYTFIDHAMVFAEQGAAGVFWAK